MRYVLLWYLIVCYRMVMASVGVVEYSIALPWTSSPRMTPCVSGFRKHEIRGLPTLRQIFTKVKVVEFLRKPDKSTHSSCQLQLASQIIKIYSHPAKTQNQREENASINLYTWPTYATFTDRFLARPLARVLPRRTLLACQSTSMSGSLSWRMAAVKSR